MTRYRRRAAGWVGLLAVLGLGGCGDGKASVGGKVTYKNRPVVTGTVIVAGPDGVQVAGVINPDGTYAVEGVKAGAVKIGVFSPNPSASRDGGRGGAATSRLNRGTEQKVDPKDWVPLPQKYAEPDTSGLAATLKPGSQTHDIDLPD